MRSGKTWAQDIWNFEDFSKPFAAFLVVGFVFGFNRSGNVSQLDGPVLQKTVVLVNMSCILFL